jgi:hypothetical protein
MGALGLAGSIAGSQQRSPASADRVQADQALQKLHADESRLAGQDLDDSVETDFSHGQVADRDADGRLPWQFPGAPSQPGEEQPAEGPASTRPADAEGDRGGKLDLDA